MSGLPVSPALGEMQKHIKIGSNDHKRLFCRNFVDGHIQYDPEQWNWPLLERDDLQRLHSVPFWMDRRAFKYKAGLIARSYAQTLDDPLLKEAIILYGKEQQRHGAVLEAFMQGYDISSPALPPIQLPNNLELAFIDLGYSACLDSFMAFGLYSILSQYHSLPAELLKFFDIYLIEEARHLVLFVNGLAYRNTKQRKLGSSIRGLQVLWLRRSAFLKLLRAFGQKEEQEALAQQWLESCSAEAFLSACLAEHRRRMAGFPTALVQPQLSPALAQVAREALRVWPKRQNSPTIHSLHP